MLDVRFIPAGAGNRRAAQPLASQPTVHPRGCGEQSVASAAINALIGSSPRVRGTEVVIDDRLARDRFIPAGAGNSSPARAASSTGSVHPRGCGEQLIGQRCVLLELGSSPRVRGTGHLHRVPDDAVRFIPAGAGNSHRHIREHRNTPVHPRGCGEQTNGLPMGQNHRGSSPRVRGTVERHELQRLCDRFIPAGAGNRAGRRRRRCSNSVHPRGCGEQSTPGLVGGACAGSSPRVRGTGPDPRSACAPIRFIPAGAGNSLHRFPVVPANPVHPRGCGEQAYAV